MGFLWLRDRTAFRASPGVVFFDRTERLKEETYSAKAQHWRILPEILFFGNGQKESKQHERHHILFVLILSDSSMFCIFQAT